MKDAMRDYWYDSEANHAIAERCNQILLDASIDEDDGYCLVCVRPYHGHGPHVREGELAWMRADPEEQARWTQYYIPSINETIHTAILLYGDLTLDHAGEVLNVWGYEGSS